MAESAARIVEDIHSRPLPAAHVITFANEKGGVGKSTLAFNCAVALANAGAEVLAIDLDNRQRTLSTALENRQATATCLNVPIACPRYSVVEKQSGAALSQEIVRLGNTARFVIIDAPGQDGVAARRAVALADTLVTPVNASFVDLQQLARFNPVTLDLTTAGPFANLVHHLQQEKVARGMAPSDWVLLKNRVRASEHRQQKRVDDALVKLNDTFGSRTASGLTERVAYRDLFVFGLIHADLKNIPQLKGKASNTPRDIDRLLAELRLPPMGLCAVSTATAQARVLARTRERYLQSLEAHLAGKRRA